jgi:hypothetical protein
MVTEKRRDLKTWPDDPEHNAAAMALQLYGGLDPDGARYLAMRVVRAFQRASTRPIEGLPTDDEVARARAALIRHGFEIDTDAVYTALLDALCPSPDSELLPTMVDSSCQICRLEGPDRFGNFDLIPDSRCPVH